MLKCFCDFFPHPGTPSHFPLKTFHLHRISVPAPHNTWTAKTLQLNTTTLSRRLSRKRRPGARHASSPYIRPVFIWKNRLLGARWPDLHACKSTSSYLRGVCTPQDLRAHIWLAVLPSVYPVFRKHWARIYLCFFRLHLQKTWFK